MALAQTTRSTSNSTNLKRPIVLMTIDGGTNWFRMSSWIASMNASGGEAAESEYKYFEGATETVTDAPGDQQWEFSMRYSEGSTEPYRNLFDHFTDTSNDSLIGIRFFKGSAVADDFGWYIDGKITFVSAPQNIDANSTNPNDFVLRVKGTIAAYTVVAGDLLATPSYA